MLHLRQDLRESSERQSELALFLNTGQSDADFEDAIARRMLRLMTSRRVVLRLSPARRTIPLKTVVQAVLEVQLDQMVLEVGVVVSMAVRPLLTQFLCMIGRANLAQRKNQGLDLDKQALI